MAVRHKPTVYREITETIEAMQWDAPPDAAIDEVCLWLTDHGVRYYVDSNDDYTLRLTIPTLEGDMVATPGDWIIRGVDGEFHPCGSAAFDATYEKAEN